ncbi:hypothetical protein CLOM_g1176 [Closterium sp. NIES-68]|nr:hypothetical protein CLOM_g1176 [Closterium sp. NIES-68]
MASRIPPRLFLLTAALVLLVAGAGAQRVVHVGGRLGRLISPWGYGLKTWKAPKVLPGDLLVFQWLSEQHSVHKVDAADYAACTFLNAKQLARGRSYGNFVYKVPGEDYDKTIYFSSNVKKDCRNGIKVAFDVKP